MAYEITATITSRKQKGFEHARRFWSEVQPTKAELRFLEKRLRQEVSGWNHFGGRPEDFDVWVEVEPASERGLGPDMRNYISVA